MTAPSLYKYELARHRALASAQRKGVPLPPVPIYRSQREWSLEVSSRQEQLERQESTIRELHEVIRDQAVSLDERREEADWIHVADHQVEKLERTERELHHVRTEALAIKKKYDQLKQDVRQLVRPFPLLLPRDATDERDEVLRQMLRRDQGQAPQVLPRPHRHRDHPHHVASPSSSTHLRISSVACPLRLSTGRSLFTIRTHDVSPMHHVLASITMAIFKCTTCCIKV